MSDEIATTPGKHRLILSLPKEKQDEIHSLIRQGTDIPRIAAIIQQKWGLCTEVTPAALGKAIARWRDDKALVQVQARLVSAGVVDNVTRLVQRVDTMNELYQLYHLQKLRIAKILTREEVLPTLMDQVGREISRASNMLEKITELQFEMGLVNRAPRVSTITPHADGSFTLRENSESVKLLEAFENDAGSWETNDSAGRKRKTRKG